MERPFKIFPSIGYKNSQYQVVSNVENLRIDIYDHDNVVTSIETNPNYPILLTRLYSTGKLVAKCWLNNEIFQQEIEIKEAFRLGSSEFKRAFVFDDTEYSFFLMKDRLLLFDEKKKILLTENHYSPTEIHQIDKTNFLFITRIGDSLNGIINLGIYNTKSFSIVGELLNDYREIITLPKTNKTWLLNIKSNTIHCFELVQKTKTCFSELRKYVGFNDFFIDNSSQNIFINYTEKVNISNTNNLHIAIEIPKSPYNAIDKLGNIFEIDDDKLICKKYLANYSIQIEPPFELNLYAENFIHIGKKLKSNIELTDLNKKVEDVRKHLISKIPEDKTYHNHLFSESERISESYVVHNIYPTINGVFIIQKEVRRDFNGVTFKRNQGIWSANPHTTESKEYTIFFFSSNNIEVSVEKVPSLTIVDFNDSLLLLNCQNKKVLFSGNNKFSIEDESSIALFTVNEISYFLIKLKEKCSLFRSSDFNTPILDQVEILNPDFIQQHQIIWYKGDKKYESETNYLNAFDLRSCSKVFFDEQNAEHSLFKESKDFKFYDQYALSSNQIVFNPKNLEVKDAFVGAAETYSNKLNKIVSLRTNIIYLSVFNNKSRKYELTEIPIDGHKYKESYLSPNGQFLVLQDETDKYIWFDIEKNEKINFFSGNFLGFRKDGNLIIEEDGRRAVKIIDPKTFQDITPPNYHHYRFVSPDGKLYAQVALKVRHINKLNGLELTEIEVRKLRRDLDEPKYLFKKDEILAAKTQVEKNRREIFLAFKRRFEEKGFEDHKSINSESVVKVEKYTEIGIVGTSFSTKVYFPDDLWFYNYFAFSYDNQYCAWVGKPENMSGGYISLIKINFDQAANIISVKDSYLSSFPNKATWICGFSKTGYFATYDSVPDTYILNVGENLLAKKTSEIELRENIYKSKSNFYHSYNNWNIIKGKNFLCFSPSGNFLALSEQGYEPLLLGGYGHQESNLVHIAETRTGKVVDSFTGHGERIKDDFRKKVTFVAFSEDEKRIMTLSSDGVVIIRDIKINNPK